MSTLGYGLEILGISDRMGGTTSLRAFTVLKSGSSGHTSSPSSINSLARGSSALSTPCPKPYIGLLLSLIHI